MQYILKLGYDWLQGITDIFSTLGYILKLGYSGYDWLQGVTGMFSFMGLLGCLIQLLKTLPHNHHKQCTRLSRGWWWEHIYKHYKEV